MLHVTKTLEFPAKLQPVYAQAIRYEWISFFYMISTSFFSFLVMSNSQTMKTIWLEDMLGIIPPLSFLIASRIVKWKANRNFPYGFHRVTTMSFFTSSLALLILGIYLLVDGVIVLLKHEHPTIPNVFFFGHSIWLGFIMIPALLWSGIPSTILGHVKLPLSRKLYDKILFTDSKMNKASWMSAFASIIGILGIGLGYWWADAGVGLLISISIIHDGYQNFKQSVFDLVDEIPKMIGNEKTDPLIADVKALIKKEDWVQSVTTRFRDEGHVFFGDILIEPKADDVSLIKLHALRHKLEQYNWRLHDIVIMPVLPASRLNGSSTPAAASTTTKKDSGKLSRSR